MSHWYDERHKPKPAKGGIKAKTQRGSFGSSWWAKRWTESLERFTDSGRLSRGRSYARNGRVLAIDVEKGKVQAEVQGSSWTPYDVKISMKPLTKAEWLKLGEALSREAYFAAKLLSGEMPQEIESVFQKEGLALFPLRSSDLRTSCSCPDYANPCKHVAAVFFLLGEEFDRNPFLIFRLRGLEQDELTDLLGSRSEQEVEARPPEPLAMTPFWEGPELPAIASEIRQGISMPLLRRLGSLPFWRGDLPWPEAFLDFYSEGSQRAREILADLK